MTQTSIQYLVEQITLKGIDLGMGIKMKIEVPFDILEKAKQMEKDQIINAYGQGYENAQNYEEIGREQYYNETYGGAK